MAIWRLLARHARALDADGRKRGLGRMTAGKLLEAIALDFVVTHYAEILENCADAEAQAAFRQIAQRFRPGDLELLGLASPGDV